MSAWTAVHSKTCVCFNPRVPQSPESGEIENKCLKGSFTDEGRKRGRKARRKEKGEDGSDPRSKENIIEQRNSFIRHPNPTRLIQFRFILWLQYSEGATETTQLGKTKVFTSWPSDQNIHYGADIVVEWIKLSPAVSASHIDASVYPNCFSSNLTS